MHTTRTRLTPSRGDDPVYPDRGLGPRPWDLGKKFISESLFSCENSRKQFVLKHSEKHLQINEGYLKLLYNFNAMPFSIQIAIRGIA